MWGSNPAWSLAGSPTYNLLQAKKAGAKFIFVDPHYSPSIKTLGDQHNPCRPGTDAALLIGMAYYMIENNLQDQDFLDRCTVGFDKDHMPEGADPKENFKDYVLGTVLTAFRKHRNGHQKFAEQILERLDEFAHRIATTKPMILTSSFAPVTYVSRPAILPSLPNCWLDDWKRWKTGCWCLDNELCIKPKLWRQTLVKAGSNGLPPVI